MTPGAFWVSLVEIVGLNIVLSADNAVVIALATRSLPRKACRRAMALGTTGAVLLRIALTVAALEVLKLPFLKLAGAALLLWIGARLFVTDSGEGTSAAAPATVGGAVRTIVFADAIMSLDNVLAVAAAAKGSIAALAVGLAISMPLIVVAAAVLLRAMHRWPIVITLAAAVIGWVAGELALADPLAAHWLVPAGSAAGWGVPACGAALVIVLGKILGARSAAA